MWTRVLPIVSWKNFFFPPFFFFFSVFFLQLLLLMFFSFFFCSWFCLFVRKFMSCVQSKSLCVTMAIEKPTLWPWSQVSWPIDRDVNASRNFDDLHGAISCRIIANKLSSFSQVQDLCTGEFVFKIGLKLSEHEARKDDLVSSQNDCI